MKIRCLLVDDEPPALKVLQSHISKISGLEVVAQCKNALEALGVLQEKTIDLVFLDIKMPKLTGMDFLKNLHSPPKVIFVTAYRDFAVESYEMNAVDYLVKPVSFERFLKAISKVNSKTIQHEVSQHQEYINNPDAFIYVKVDRGMQKVILDEIAYIESWKDYVKIFLVGGRKILATHPISKMEILLSTHRFLRIHRSYIVSMNKITGYNNHLISMNDLTIPIGRYYKQHVIETLQSR